MSNLQEEALTMRQTQGDIMINDVPKKLKLRGLSYRQRKFCLLYPATGSPYRACIEAGYHANESVPTVKSAKVRSTVSALMRNKQIRDNIDLMNEELVKHGIASAVRIQVFWNGIMEDEDLPIKIRMEASKLLAQCYPEFSERVVIEQHSSHVERKEINVVFQHLPPGELGRSFGLASEQQPLIDTETADTEPV